MKSISKIFDLSLIKKDLDISGLEIMQAASCSYFITFK